jgi:glycosyltransferase involved in cell wall biosynthesis
VAVLASPVVYGESLRPGETGLLFHDPESFGRELRRLIADASLRRRLARQAYEYVRQERLQIRHFRSRYDWYRRLVKEKPQLDAALRARAPELFT